MSLKDLQRRATAVRPPRRGRRPIAEMTTGEMRAELTKTFNHATGSNLPVNIAEPVADEVRIWAEALRQSLGRPS